MSRITAVLALALTVGLAGTASAQWGNRRDGDHDRDQRGQWNRNDRQDRNQRERNQQDRNQYGYGSGYGGGYGAGLPSRLDPRLFRGISLTQVQVDRIRTIDARYQQVERQYGQGDYGRQTVSSAELRDVRAALGPHERSIFDANLSILGSAAYGGSQGNGYPGNSGYGHSRGRGHGHGHGYGHSGDRDHDGDGQ